MNVFQIISLVALAYCIGMLMWHFVRIIKLGKPKDLSVKSGDVGKGVAYANTVAMMPTHKESAYMHIPTYAAGMIYHCGTFLSILLFFLSLFELNIWYPEWLNLILALCVCASAICGVLLLVKRCVNKNLSSLANPDDYLSNLFTTLFQCATIAFLLTGGMSNTWMAVYYIVVSVLLIYMPLGKLKHLLYYFSARYHLGFFYGWRNTWPPKKEE
ncbi:MAG: hypothetical protein MJZ49_06450 [Bacteroidales bacterium]|nr:hypothetical protein [Bacteroidales bacterium]